MVECSTWDSRVAGSNPPFIDSLTANQFRAIPLGIIVRIFNLILWCENLPKHLAISRTIFIPKKSQASLPGEFRPSYISVFARGLHKILAQRIDAKIEMDDQKRAFRAGMDGCRDNTCRDCDLLSLSNWESGESGYVAVGEKRPACRSRCSELRACGRLSAVHTSSTINLLIIDSPTLFSLLSHSYSWNEETRGCLIPTLVTPTWSSPRRTAGFSLPRRIFAATAVVYTAHRLLLIPLMRLESIRVFIIGS